MSWSGLAKFLIGVSLAIAILVGGGAVAGMYFFNKFTVVPPKPIFDNDTVKVRRGRTAAAAKAKRMTVATKPGATPSPNDRPSPQPLEPGAYKARVNWSEGLLLRSGPTPDAERVGGVGYNQTVVVLQESPDKTWQRIRLEGSKQEGWIKSGNTEKIEAQQ